jgi:hypothetical protein
MESDIDLVTIEFLREHEGLRELRYIVFSVRELRDGR